MTFTKHNSLTVILLFFLSLIFSCNSPQNTKYADIIIYGGTSAGINAAAAACLAITEDLAVQELPYHLLSDHLQKKGQILTYPR